MPVLPVPGSVTSPYLGGYRYQGGHSGTDFAGAHGDPVGSAAQGRVVSAGWAGAYGYRVVVQHPGGTQTTYSHLSRITVQPGQEVRPGQMVGQIGSTGNSSGPHLHFEVFQDGQMTDPMRWLAGAEPVTVTGGDGAVPTEVQASESIGIRVTPVYSGEFQTGMPAFAPVAGDLRFGITAEDLRFDSPMDLQEEAPDPLADINDLGQIQWLQQAQTGESTLDQGQGSARWTGGGVEQIIQQSYNLMRSVGASHEEARMLAAFVIPESSGNPGVVNSIGATGLWQVLVPVHGDRLAKFGFTAEDMKNPYKNALVAYDIFKDQGYSAWEVYTRDLYQQYLR